MSLKICGIFVILFVLTQSREVPKLSEGHAWIGDYPDMNMKRCGYLSPKDDQKTESRIIEGDFSELGEFPWHASIYVKKQTDLKQICGGALVHQFWVLTAKQCFHPSNESSIEANNLIVSLGSIKKTEFYQKVDVLSIFEHSKESIALLRLKEAVIPVQSADGNDYRINFVCLPKKMITNTHNEDAIISSFGYTQVDNKPPNDRLRKAVFLIDPIRECNQRIGYLDSQYICGTESVHMTCFEDIGSSLVQFDGKRAVVIGITQKEESWEGHTCGMGVLVFYRVSYFIGWIREYISNNVTTISPIVSTTVPISTITKPTKQRTTLTTTSVIAGEHENNHNFAQNLKTNLNIVLILILLNFYLITYKSFV